MSSPPSGGGGAYPIDLKCSAALSRAPWYTGAPSLSNMRSSNWLNTSGVGCSRATTAHPPVVLAHALSAATMLNVTAASRPVEISSMQSTLALVTSASEMVTRFFSPPDTPLTKSLPTMVSTHPSSARRFVTASSLRAWSVWSAGVGVALSWMNLAVSPTLMKGRWVSTCSTYAASLATSTPRSCSSSAVSPL